MPAARILLPIAVIALAGYAILADPAWLALLGGLLVGSSVRGWRERDPAAQLEGDAADNASTWHAQALSNSLDAISEGVLVLDRRNRVLAFNAPFRQLLLLPGRRRPGGQLEDLVDWPQLSTALLQARGDGASTQFEARQGADEDVRHLSVHLLVSRDGQAVVVLRDITRLRQLESYRRDFVANVSHELKTPLAAIQGFVETLIDDPDVPEDRRQHFLQRVQRQVSRLGSLVANLLALSRLDESRPLPSDPCDLVVVVTEAERDLQPMAEAKGLYLDVALPPHPVWIIAEREALRQVVSNLIDNALKYTTEGSVSVSLESNGRSCTLEVVDTGIGLSEADQARVFERFYRVDKARSTELGGTGLGLSIVKNSVQAIGGEIGVESQPGQGSRFWVRLPSGRPGGTLAT